MSKQNDKVKNKFFNQELFNDVNVNDVGGSSSGGNVISWGVGGKNNSNVKPVEADNNIGVLDSTQMFNFVNTEVTDFVENNSFSNNVNNNSMQNSETGLFDGAQFANSMEGQQTIQTGNVSNNEFATNVNDVFASVKFDASVGANAVSNEFASETPTFFGYNANPEVVQVNNVNSNATPAVEGNVVAPEFANNENVSFNNSDVQVSVEQTSVVQENPLQDASTQDNWVGKTDGNNTIAVPAFDPFNSMAEPVSTHVPETHSAPVNDADYQMQQNSPLFAMAAETQSVDTSSFSGNASPTVIDANTVGNQPLSMAVLSGEIQDEALKPRDVSENAKYFQKTTIEDNRLRLEDVVPTVAPVVDVLAEPSRDLNIRELMVAYVGPKYQKISMSPFSFCGAFFTAFYFYFRKMYLQGFILTIINTIISIVMYKSYVIGLGLTLGEFIIVGLLTNALYLSHAEKQVKKIAMENPKMNHYDLLRIIPSKGGTAFFVALLISIILSFVTTPIINIVGGVPSWAKDLTNPGQAIIELDKKASLDEIITYDLPEEFKRVDSGSVPYIIEETKFVRGKKINITSCGFNIYLVDGADTSKEFLQKMADAEGRYNRVFTYKTENEEVWDSYEYDHSSYYYLYRARKIKGHIVLVTYQIDARATEGMCETHLENIMNSIKKK